MNFQKLKYAVVVADSGSFREAARRLYMAQSSLSTAIKELEEEYQIQIFERTRKGITITEEGSEFLSYARSILADVDLMEQHYLEPTGRQMFSVSGQHYDFASQAFALLVNEDKDREEEWDYRFLETDTNEVLQDVKSAYSELGLLYLNDNNEKVINQYLQRFELEFEELGTFSPQVFLGKNHPLADRESLTMEDLEPYPVIRFEQAKGSNSQFSEEATEDKIEGQTVIHVSDRATVINLLAETDAFLIGSGLVTSPFKDLETIIPLENESKNRIGFITARYRKLSDVGQRYIDLMKENIQSAIE